MFQKHIRVHAHTRTRVCITSYNSSGDDKNTIHAYNNLSIMKMIVDVKMASSSRRENLAKEKERFELQMSGIYMYTKGYTKPWPRNYDKLRKGEGGRFNYTAQQVVERGENVETSINTKQKPIDAPLVDPKVRDHRCLKPASKRFLAHAGRVQWAPIPYIESVSGDRSMPGTPCKSDNRQFATGYKTSVGPKTKRLDVIETRLPPRPLLRLERRVCLVIGAVQLSNRTGPRFDPSNSLPGYFQWHGE